MITIYKFIGKNGKSYELSDERIKGNSNCPASEKSGTGPGSCGGNVSKSDKADMSESDFTVEKFMPSIQQLADAYKLAKSDAKAGGLTEEQTLALIHKYQKEIKPTVGQLKEAREKKIKFKY